MGVNAGVAERPKDGMIHSLVRDPTLNVQNRD